MVKYDYESVYEEQNKDDELDIIPWCKYNEAHERENKLIDMIYKSKEDYCPESLDLETDYKYKSKCCGGDDVKCRECWRLAINKELDK